MAFASGLMVLAPCLSKKVKLTCFSVCFFLKCLCTTMTNLCNTDPSRVTNVTLTIIGATSLNVTWAIPQSDLLITQYQVQYRTDDTSWSSAPPLSGSPPPSSTVLNGMHAGCIVRVRALSDVGGGEWSPEQMLVGTLIYILLFACHYTVCIMAVFNSLLTSSDKLLCIHWLSCLCFKLRLVSPP